eukprot:3244630-Prymnesium_polylepis.1
MQRRRRGCARRTAVGMRSRADKCTHIICPEKRAVYTLGPCARGGFDVHEGTCANAREHAMPSDDDDDGTGVQTEGVGS